MILQDKLVMLRKKNGWSQEDLAEKLGVSRQAVSRWENGSAWPDAQNILQISRLFGVTTDYLLNDGYASDEDIPVVQDAKNETNDVTARKKRLHLTAAIAFSIATICSFAVVLTGNGGAQLGVSVFMLVLCAANAILQFVLYFRKK